MRKVFNIFTASWYMFFFSVETISSQFFSVFILFFLFFFLKIKVTFKVSLQIFLLDINYYIQKLILEKLVEGVGWYQILDTEHNLDGFQPNHVHPKLILSWFGCINWSWWIYNLTQYLFLAKCKLV